MGSEDIMGKQPVVQTLHAIIEGRVQGVGFRLFVQREAKKRGLSGGVRNLPDGNVEVWARGEASALTELDDLLRKGPLFSRVDLVTVRWNPEEPWVGSTDFALID